MRRPLSSVRQFLDLVRSSPDAIVEPGECGSLWLVHPLADEVELLEQLGIARESVSQVHAYWKRASDVWFVQLEQCAPGAPRERSWRADRRGIYAGAVRSLLGAESLSRVVLVREVIWWDQLLSQCRPCSDQLEEVTDLAATYR